MIQQMVVGLMVITMGSQSVKNPQQNKSKLKNPWESPRIPHDP